MGKPYRDARQIWWKYPPAIKRGKGSGFLSEGSSWLTACIERAAKVLASGRMRRLAWTFAARIGNKYQIRLTRSIYWHQVSYPNLATENSITNKFAI